MHISEIDIDSIPEGVARVVVKTPSGGERIITACDETCVLTRHLQGFFSDNPEAWDEASCIVSRKETSITLRMLDFLVTNYSYTRNTTYMVHGRPFYLFGEYKSLLRGFGKRNIDAFARLNRVIFELPDRGDGRRRRLITSIGQLNFMKWAILNGVTTFAREHAREIAEEMERTSRLRTAMRTPNHRVRSRTRPALMRMVRLEGEVAPFQLLR